MPRDDRAAGFSTGSVIGPSPSGGTAPTATAPRDEAPGSADVTAIGRGESTGPRASHRPGDRPGEDSRPGKIYRPGGDDDAAGGAAVPHEHRSRPLWRALEPYHAVV